MTFTKVAVTFTKVAVTFTKVAATLVASKMEAPKVAVTFTKVAATFTKVTATLVASKMEAPKVAVTFCSLTVRLSRRSATFAHDAMTRCAGAGGPKVPSRGVSYRTMVGSQAPYEGSVTASLRELERLEEQRIRDEREQRRRDHEVAEAAREAAVRRDEDARRARERLEEEAWLARTRLEREDAVRVAAIERAIGERARTEATEHANAEEHERAHRRELELVAASGTRAHARLRRLVVTLAITSGVIVLGGALVYATVLAPRWERRATAGSADATAQGQTIADLRSKLALQQQVTREARRDIDDAANRAAELDAQLGEARRELERLRHARVTPARTLGVAPGGHPAESGFSTTCDPGSHDPLCGNLGR